MSAPTIPTLADVRAGQQRIKGIAIRTPLVRVPSDIAKNAWLKLENLQPIGAFKIRGAANAMALAEPDTLRDGVYTASAGNMAQGVAWCARELDVPCSVVVPDHAPKAKTDAIERLGGSVVRVPFDVWWQTLIDHGYPGMRGLFVHPFADPAVMAGNGTIALEIFEDLAGVDVSSIMVPYGGGGLSCGIAAATRALSPATKVLAVEADTAAPLTASLAAGKPTTVEMTRTWIDGMGSNAVSAEMWPLVTELLAGTRVVSVDQVTEALRILVSRIHVVAEGAGAAALAAVIAEEGTVVGIVSGGNIDLTRLVGLLA